MPWYHVSKAIVSTPVKYCWSNAASDSDVSQTALVHNADTIPQGQTFDTLEGNKNGIGSFVSDCPGSVPCVAVTASNDIQPNCHLCIHHPKNDSEVEMHALKLTSDIQSTDLYTIDDSGKK